MRKIPRIGMGYDVHELVENRKLILGGVEVPHELGLLGHSDADVLTHAIMDAICGALSLGDIGKLFPDTDMQYKDISSLVLLSRVMEHAERLGFEVGNVDATVAAQRPKLRPFIDEMRKNLAEVLQVDIDEVNVKATTTEWRGFVGREEGMESYAVVSMLPIEL